MKKLILLFFAASLFLYSCNNTAKETEASDMADFADDQEFKDAHDGPREVEMNGAGEMINFPTSEGQAEGSAYALMTETNATNYLFVIHEWWGLNENIKAEAERLFGSLENVNVLALDMYDGKVATSPDDAGKFMQAVKEDRAKAIIEGAMKLAGEDAQIATIGWCFGGGWSLKTSIMAGDQGIGCVMYYGMPVQNAAELAPLKADILGIFAKNDGWINPEVVSKFEQLAKAAGKNIETHQYDADHAFANPSSEAYVEEAAQAANTLALDFLKSKYE